MLHLIPTPIVYSTDTSYCWTDATPPFQNQPLQKTTSTSLCRKFRHQLFVSAMSIIVQLWYWMIQLVHKRTSKNTLPHVKKKSMILPRYHVWWTRILGLILYSCAGDRLTKMLVNGEMQQARFSFPAFRFTEQQNQTVSTYYLHCITRLCERTSCMTFRVNTMIQYTHCTWWGLPYKIC